MRIKKGDNVQVIAGKGSVKGITGKVLKVFPKKEMVLVEGYNIIKRHTKPNKNNQRGGIIEKESPVHVSNVMLLSSKTGKTTRIGMKMLENGKKVRFSRKFQEEVD
ncbi:MAG: 50S ribosomal protein L24 [Fibrobacteres bacterium]|nr:50S ribosomal protein L24 [Fibrobacterota bacterium]